MGLFDKQSATTTAATPSTTAISNAQQASGTAAAQNSQDQYNWAKDTNAKDTTTADDAVSSALNSQNELDKSADTDRTQYENSAYPALQNEKNDAATYASSAKKDLDVGSAQAGVAQSYDAARNNSIQALKGYGVANPSGGKFAALDIETRASQAAAQAAAGTTASNNVDATARALNHQVYTDSSSLAAQSNSEHAASTAAGTSAVNDATTNATTGASTMGTGTSWAGTANTANSGASTTINNTASTNNDATKTNNAAAKQNNETSSGVGTALGTAAGLFLAKGGAVDPGAATPGGAVPAGASPTGGKAVDDVPANLTAGEFVMPKDVVAWKGQEYFHKQIAQARKASSDVTAKPTVGPAVGGPATFQSRPQQGAIPMGRTA